MIVLFLTTFVWAATVDVTSENLKELLEKGNLQVSASKSEMEAAKEKEGYLMRSFLPSIELHGADESFKKGREEWKTQPTYGAEMKINLFNGGRDKIENEVRQLGTDQKKYQAQRVLSEQLEKTRNLYWEVLYLREKQSLIRATQEINTKNLNSAKNRIKNGVATESDRFEFEMQEVDLSRELAEIQVEEKSKIQMLRVLLGVPEKAQLNLPEKFSHDHGFETNLNHKSQDHDFLYKEYELQSEQLVLSAKSSERSWWPKIDAYAGYNQYNEKEEEFPSSRDRQESVIGVKVTLSLSAGFESQRQGAASRKEAIAQHKMADLQRKEVEVHLDAEMSELKLLHDQVHLAEQNIERAERYYKLTQSEYGRGVKNSPDILGASEKLFERKHKRLEIIRDFQLAKAHILSKLGK